eukprot:283596-Amphidinium_carterae.1
MNSTPFKIVYEHLLHRASTDSEMPAGTKYSEYVKKVNETAAESQVHEHVCRMRDSEIMCLVPLKEDYRNNGDNKKSHSKW